MTDSVFCKQFNEASRLPWVLYHVATNMDPSSRHFFASSGFSVGSTATGNSLLFRSCSTSTILDCPLKKLNMVPRRKKTTLFPVISHLNLGRRDIHFSSRNDINYPYCFQRTCINPTFKREKVTPKSNK